MRPRGVTNHTMPLFVAKLTLVSSEDFARLIELVKANLDATIDVLVPCDPACIVLGMSAETFWDGMESPRKLEARPGERAEGRRITMGSEACEAALKVAGVKRIGIIAPYWPAGEKQVRRFFTEAGYGITGLKRRSPHHIAVATDDTLRDAMRELDAANPDAIAHVGTNLRMVLLLAGAERWLQKLVIATNTEIYWRPLTRNGISERIRGCGSLPADYGSGSRPRPKQRPGERSSRRPYPAAYKCHPHKPVAASPRTPEVIRGRHRPMHVPSELSKHS